MIRLCLAAYLFTFIPFLIFAADQKEIESLILSGLNQKIEKEIIDLCIGKTTYLYYQKDHCGASGCEYFLIEAIKSSGKPQFNLLGSFFGRYKISNKFRNSCRNLTILENKSMDQKRDQLYFDGVVYVKK